MKIMKSSYRYRKRQRRFGPNSSNMLPKFLFIGIAFLGAFLVCVVKSQNWALLPTISVPISLIFMYCGLAWKSPWFYVREDQIGDNAYYLGFLFTLSSLAYALWKFSADGVGSDPADIIVSFGVALWSTIVGIGLRVFFSQMRQDPQEIEKEARVRIAETASLLSGELYQASLTFNTYTRSLQQSMEEAFLQARETATTGLNSSIETFTTTTTSMVTKIDEAFTEFSDQAKKLNTASSKTITALELLNERIEKVEAPDILINKKVDQIFTSLESSTNKLDSLSQRQTGAVENLVQSSSMLIQNIKSLNEQISSMKDSSAIVGTGAQNMQRITILVQELQASLAHLSDGFSNLQQRQLQAVEGIEQHATAMGKQLERSRKYTEETHESLVSMSKVLAEKLQ